MFKKSLLVSVLLLAATPAFADLNSCYEPIPPAPVDGSTATEKQMKAAHDDTMDFIKSSDDYQTCIGSELQKMKKAAAADKDKKPLDPAILADAQARLDKNQKLKEKVGAEFNTAVVAYKAKHP